MLNPFHLTKKQSTRACKRLQIVAFCVLELKIEIFCLNHEHGCCDCKLFMFYYQQKVANGGFLARCHHWQPFDCPFWFFVLKLKIPKLCLNYKYNCCDCGLFMFYHQHRPIVLFNDETWQVNYCAKPISLDMQRLPKVASC